MSTTKRQSRSRRRNIHVGRGLALSKRILAEARQVILQIFLSQIRHNKAQGRVDTLLSGPIKTARTRSGDADGWLRGRHDFI